MSTRFLILTIFLVGLGLAFAPSPAPRSASQQRVFWIEASRFTYSPSELRVSAGDTVTIHLVSTDVVHGIYVDGYDISVEADPGQTATLVFVADWPGSFRFRCHVSCGAMHPFMIGRLVVGSHAWLARSVGLALLATAGAIVSAGQKA